ncbi:hypothetical protein B7P33_17150 [Sediminicola luteus]|uniref:Uncharacterized protein n=1 Tax=Sediminicola luteus TaxID=319238 RepID=A0A2A4G5I0_9FLAO|nr:hypothetical protein B7P33_17150 [Sediminicola luteus]
MWPRSCGANTMIVTILTSAIFGPTFLIPYEHWAEWPFTPRNAAFCALPSCYSFFSGNRF